MKTYGLAVIALLAGISLSLPSMAQSPWESGNFKGYDQPAPATEDSGGIGLKGFSLSPDSDAGTPTPAPTANVPAAAPSILPSVTPAGPRASSASSTNSDANPIRGAIQDTTFVAMSQQSLSALTQASQLAQKNATSDMQSYAEQVISIYSGMQSELGSLIKKNNIPSTGSINFPSDMDKLKTLSGTDFNKQYMLSQMREFALLSEAFKKESESGQSAALKSYAAKHLDMVQQQKTMVLQSYMSLIGQGASPVSAR